jgi:arylsulfatase A-like enzyme
MMAASIVFALKAGASIFYYKLTIVNSAVKPDSGYAYRYLVPMNPLLFRAQDMLVFEDGHQLSHIEGKTVIETGNGVFSVSKPPAKSIYLYFSASDNSNPVTNERKYSLYIPFSFISRPLGVIYLLILSPVLIWFLSFTLTNSDQRKILVGSLTGILKVLDAFFDDISTTFRPDTLALVEQIKARPKFWRQLFSVTVLAAFFYIFMEWLFFVTKPSFMNMLSYQEKVGILLISGLFLSIYCMAVLATFIVLDLIMIVLRRSRVTQYLGATIPTVILSALALLLIDNFTYTVFSIGISTSSGALRGAYRFLFALIFILIYLEMLGIFGLRRKDLQRRKNTYLSFYLSTGILAVSTILALTGLDVNRSTINNSTAQTASITSDPNIILLGTDGLSAKNLSVYGYGRDTTPNLQKLAQNSLLAMNAFSNSGNTAGSVISIMTSKYPTTTRVADGTDILTGANAFQHLPGILKSEGYKTVEYGVTNQVDAYSFNMQNSFDIANDRSQRAGALGSLAQELGYNYPAYFLDNLTWRISERMLHIFYIREMENPYLLVTKPPDALSDQQKIDDMLSLVGQTEAPVFAHVHLLGTHGPEYSPSIRVFSQGEEQTEEWMVDFYDDAILSFDQYVGEVVDQLKATGEYENTVLIIYTDHDTQWGTMKRIPLIIHFPNDEHAGEISSNVQNMDIAPTILDYLGLPKPDWMSGNSLLDPDLLKGRVILGVTKINQLVFDATGKPVYDPALTNPPFYEFGAIFAIDCQKWWLLDLRSLQLTSGEVPGYVEPCSPTSLHNDQEIIRQFDQRLSADGFNTSEFSKITIEGP